MQILLSTIFSLRHSVNEKLIMLFIYLSQLFVHNLRMWKVSIFFILDTILLQVT